MLSEWQHAGFAIRGEQVAVDAGTIAGMRPLRPQRRA
jgi:hypothetical protein